MFDILLAYKNHRSIFEFSVEDTHGRQISLARYKGEVVIVTNVAAS